jgi:hypothetical protein
MDLHSGSVVGNAHRGSFGGRKANKEYRQHGLEDVYQDSNRGKQRNRGSIFTAIQNRHLGDGIGKGRRVSTLWAPDHEIATTNAAGEHNQELLMSFERDGLDVKEYRQGGDKEMDTPENLAKRKELRSNKQVVKILTRYFKTCGSARKTGFISKPEYIYFHIRIARALITDDGTPAEMTKRAAEEEWDREVNVLPMMPQEIFMDSVFEIADIWTPTIDVDLYIDFLTKVRKELQSVHFSPPPQSNHSDTCININNSTPNNKPPHNAHNKTNRHKRKRCTYTSTLNTDTATLNTDVSIFLTSALLLVGRCWS